MMKLWEYKVFVYFWHAFSAYFTDYMFEKIYENIEEINMIQN